VSRYKQKLKPLNESGYTRLIVSRCGYPGLTWITNLNGQPIVMDKKDQKKKEGSGCLKHLQFLLGWPSRSPGKKCDKQLTFIVRVIASAFLFIYTIFKIFFLNIRSAVKFNEVPIRIKTRTFDKNVISENGRSFQKMS
jgi:hypothetical protein